MKEITIDELLKLVRSYNACEEKIVRKAYEYANVLHKGQYRQSGEEYISHPLNVAYILAEMHADKDTLCAALLHDTLEDTSATKEEISELFNPTIANLVDGVTKLKKMNFSSKEEENMANTRKIITGITEDVRIIIIKLADRLHNMRTLEYKSKFKQEENSLETMEIFVPLAYYIGNYRIKSELEDISFKYLKPKKYREFTLIRMMLEDECRDSLNEMVNKIEEALNNKGIDSEIKVRTKNVYGIFKKIEEGNKLSDIHDLLSIKIMVNTIEECYMVLYLVHRLYHPMNEKFKDYICNPKTNMYSSLHTTVFGPDNRMIQVQIRTHEMDKIASFGLTTYWDINKGDARKVMQEDLKNKYQFFESLSLLDSMFCDNYEFVNQVKSELFSSKIYVYTSKGDRIELPKGSTPIDFAYKVHTDVGNTMVRAMVNDEYVPIDYQLKNKDRIRIITDELSDGPKEDWLEIARTSYARRRIHEFSRKRHC